MSVLIVIRTHPVLVRAILQKNCAVIIVPCGHDRLNAIHYLLIVADIASWVTRNLSNG